MTDPNSQNMLTVIKNEKFLAFFNFYMSDENNESVLDGMCKIAIPEDTTQLNYLSMSFVFDTPSEYKYELARSLMEKLTTKSFQKLIPQVFGISTNISVRLHTDFYLHHVDVIFQHDFKYNIKEIIDLLAKNVRCTMGLDTEVPQFWEDENDIPQLSESEKKNWTSRLKALISYKNEHHQA